MLNNKIRNPFPMIGKVFKYEFKSGTRTILPIYGAMMILALFCGLFITNSRFENTAELFQVILGCLFGLTYFAGFIITLVIIAKRFKKGMLEDEAYLNYSLPVTMTEHIIGRLLVFVVWFLMYVLASFISTCLFFVTEWGSAIADFGDLFTSFYEEFGVHFSGFFAMFVLYGISLTLLVIMFIFVVNAIAHLIKKNRLLVEVVTVIVLFIVFGNVIKLLIEPSIDAYNPGLGADLFYIIMWKMIILNFITVVLDVIATQAILKFRLNLE